MLIANGASLSARDKVVVIGLTPLYYATRKGHKEIVELLIAAGASATAMFFGNQTLLFYAAGDGHTEIAELLIANGADVNAKSVGGSTPLHQAAFYGQKETAELLIAEGADVNAQRPPPQTPLDVAAFSGRKEISDLLRKNGGRTAKEIAEGVPYLYLFYSKDQLSIYGEIGLKFDVRYSSDLKEWKVLDTVTLESSPQIYLDQSAAEQPMRFYQLRLVE